MKVLLNISDNLLTKLIHLKKPITMEIRNVILNQYPTFNRQRLLLFGDDKKFMNQVRKERFDSRKLNPIESRKYLIILL